ncbi:hypothetical protein EQO05_10225 [Methanosarcina sp. MSH10X1]|uniref:hypothetical protein n=1 Tax=Methanosarcina sp. MSH10X1 TaxID=2507075 RepID=UPI000FFC6C5C|nr:hypothetical protein [Methanosarcina sp. MSH10X1]RXA19025.1 hypothetical protein EQO05_10225 [Methanosarcina sp. MSH10X1]
MLYRKRHYQRDKPAQRKPFAKRLERKLFQKKFDQKRMLYRKWLDGVINRRNGCGAAVALKRANLQGCGFSAQVLFWEQDLLCFQFKWDPILSFKLSLI